MATLFIDLFDEFLQTEVSSLDLAKKYTQPQLSSYLSTLLKRAREEYYNFAIINPPSIIPKMQDCVEFWSQEYDFTYTGTSFTTIINPFPPIGSLYYIAVDGVAVSNSSCDDTDNASYDNTSGNLTVNMIRNTTHSVNIIFWLDGQFNQDLSLVEGGIIVDWLGVLFQKDKIREQKLYNLAITGRDDGMASQANHMRALQTTYAYDRKAIIQRMVDYTYLNDPNKLFGLGARG